MDLLAAANWALFVLTASCLLLAALTALRRRWRRRSDRHAAAVLEPLRPALLDLVSGAADDIAHAVAVVRSVPAADWPPVRDTLVGFLGKFRGSALEPVVEVLTARALLADARRDLAGRSAIRRGRAAHVLGLLQDHASRDRLERTLRDRDPDVRVAAARALGRIAAPASAGPLLAAVSAARPIPPGVVADALCSLGAGAETALRHALAEGDVVTRSVSADISGLVGAIGLADELRVRLAEDPSADVRARAATALGRLGVPSAVDGLVAALRPDETATVRHAAASALGALGDPAAVPALQAVLAGGGLGAELAADALTALGPDGFVALEASADPSRPSAASGALALAVLRGVR